MIKNYEEKKEEYSGHQIKIEHLEKEWSYLTGETEAFQTFVKEENVPEMIIRCHMASSNEDIPTSKALLEQLQQEL